jgi:hypothetical protein
MTVGGISTPRTQAARWERSGVEKSVRDVGRFKCSFTRFRQFDCDRSNSLPRSNRKSALGAGTTGRSKGAEVWVQTSTGFILAALPFEPQLMMRMTLRVDVDADSTSTRTRCQDAFKETNSDE